MRSASLRAILKYDLMADATWTVLKLEWLSIELKQRPSKAEEAKVIFWTGLCLPLAT
jgi:hypothetical protein